MKTIAVVGASGFVGSVLVEHLLSTGEYDVRPLIHTSGNAWRLARRNLQLRSVDILSPQSIQAAISGCTHVVNCSRGSSEVMVKGLRNLLQVCRECKVERFVHLSSVAVYGEKFPTQSLAPQKPTLVTEDSPLRAARGTYGWKKLRQDKLVWDAHRQGLSSVVLCPPNICGAHASSFMLDILGVLHKRELALVDNGQSPCPTVDVENLVHAIKLALTSRRADGQRIFVNDDEPVSWARMARSLAELAETEAEPPVISTAEVAAMFSKDNRKRPSLFGSAKHLLSSEVREALGKDPLLSSIGQFALGLAGKLPHSIQNRLRDYCNPPASFTPNNDLGQKEQVNEPVFSKALLRQQLRNVRYSCERAKQVLGYSPVVDFEESVGVFRSWYAVHHGWGSEWWPLLTQLNWRA